MNAKFNLTLLILFLFLICMILYKQTEGWEPWVWNIPTRDIYPPLYYDLRCQPPVHHYYRKTSCPLHLNKQFRIRPLYSQCNCPYNF